MSKLFSSFQLKSIELKNRLVMPAMCQYSAQDGFANSWHFVHYGTRAVGQFAALIQEATAVTPEGRISLGDLGIWKDEQIENLKKITDFAHSQNCKMGIQLAHAGRKASCALPSEGGKQLKATQNAWQTVSASSIPFDADDTPPKSLTKEEVKTEISNFKKAAQRAIKAGYDILELHAAHGYLIHQFLSPLANQRTDEYGGSFGNRIRFLVEIVKEINTILPSEVSLWVRISATDWTEGGWDAEESVALCKVLKELNVELVNVSTGGLVRAKIPVGKNYQVPFAEKIKKEVEIPVAAVGLITEAKQAEEILQNNWADVILTGRKALRNPYFPLESAKELGEVIDFPIQYARWE